MPEQQRQSNLLLITAFLPLAALRIRVGNGFRCNPRGIVREDLVLGQSGDTGVEESLAPIRLLGEFSEELRHLLGLHGIPVRQQFSAHPRLEEIGGIRARVHPVEGDGEDLVGVVRSPCLRQILQQTGPLRDCVVDGKFSHKEGGEGRQKRLSGRIRQIGSHILAFSLGRQGLLRSATLRSVTVEVTAVVLGCVIDVVNNIPQVLPFFLAALIDGVPVVAPDDHAEIAVGVADDFGLFLGKRKPNDIRRIGHDIHRDFRGAGGSFRHDYTDSLDTYIIS